MAALNSPERPPVRTHGTPLRHNQLVFALVGIVALGLGVWQIRTSLSLPLGSPEPILGTPDISPGDTTVSDEILRQRDTDSDGLSDYDEQYLYKTSAYLKDSDSDGYDDKTEVTSGNDPLCPPGQACNEPAPSGAIGTPEEAPPDLNAAQIRELLKKSGVSDTEISRYTDEQLVALYRELAGKSASPDTTVGTTTQLTAEQRDVLSKLKGAELRQFLIRGGADEQQLKSLDDASLEALVKEMISAP